MDNETMDKNIKSLISRFEQLANNISKQNNQPIRRAIPRQASAKAPQQERTEIQRSPSVISKHKTNTQKLNEIEAQIRELLNQISDLKDVSNETFIHILITLVMLLLKLGEIDVDGNYNIKNKKDHCLKQLQMCNVELMKRRSKDYDGVQQDIAEEEVPVPSIRKQHRPVSRQTVEVKEEVNRVPEVSNAPQQTIRRSSIEREDEDKLQFKSVRLMRNIFEVPNASPQQSFPKLNKLVRQLSQESNSTVYETKFTGYLSSYDRSDVSESDEEIHNGNALASLKLSNEELRENVTDEELETELRTNTRFNNHEDGSVVRTEALDNEILAKESFDNTIKTEAISNVITTIQVSREEVSNTGSSEIETNLRNDTKNKNDKQDVLEDEYNSTEVVKTEDNQKNEIITMVVKETRTEIVTSDDNNVTKVEVINNIVTNQEDKIIMFKSLELAEFDNIYEKSEEKELKSDDIFDKLITEDDLENNSSDNAFENIIQNQLENNDSLESSKSDSSAETVVSLGSTVYLAAQSSTFNPNQDEQFQHEMLQEVENENCNGSEDDMNDTPDEKKEEAAIEEKEEIPTALQEQNDNNTHEDFQRSPVILIKETKSEAVEGANEELDKNEDIASSNVKSTMEQNDKELAEHETSLKESSEQLFKEEDEGSEYDSDDINSELMSPPKTITRLRSFNESLSDIDEAEEERRTGNFTVEEEVVPNNSTSGTSASLVLAASNTLGSSQSKTVDKPQSKKNFDLDDLFSEIDIYKELVSYYDAETERTELEKIEEKVACLIVDIDEYNAGDDARLIAKKIEGIKILTDIMRIIAEKLEM